MAEEENKPEDDECDDWLFHEGDTDSDTEGEFLDSEDTSVFPDEDVHGVRRCLEVRLCRNTQHDGQFIGSRFIEIFKVRLKFNDKLSNNKTFTNSRIYGEIVTELPEHSQIPHSSIGMNRDNLFPISYYCASRHNTDLVLNLNGSDNKSILLPISGPKPRPPLYVNPDDCVYLKFALKIDDDQDIFTSSHRLDHYNPLLFGDHTVAKQDLICFHPNFDSRGDRDYGPFATEYVLGNPESDRILVYAHYAVHRGSSATIEVKMLKKGVGSFYGVINARICVFYSRIRLLTIQREGKKVSIQREDTSEVGYGGRIKLTRSVVAVPNYASLIIGAQLYDDHNKSLICCGRTAFSAKASGDETSFITYNGDPTIEVRVQWKSEFPCFTSPGFWKDKNYY